MDRISIITICKELGCCDACSVRYTGVKDPAVFEAPHEYVSQVLGSGSEPPAESEEAPPAKRSKEGDTCVSCLGVLEEPAWAECLDAVRRTLAEKPYECDELACALAAPLAVVVRERAVAAHLELRLPAYDRGCATPLKEAWKWRRGAALAASCGKRLGAGGAAPLLVTLRLEYEHDASELEALERGAGSTRRAAEAACDRAEAGALRARAAAPAGRARVAAAEAEARPLALGGRYVKLSRSLPQTPWLVDGRRALPSSVQDEIFAALAEALRLPAAAAERRLKFVAAGREDVDVRCLGEGRPFAVEVADPLREPTAAELARACERIAEGGRVRVRRLVAVSREKLGELKRGEESKCKTYCALVIKLGPSQWEVAAGRGAAPVAVRAEDVARAAGAGGALAQRTPLRVLHRRPLLARARRVWVEAAAPVPGHERLLALRLRTEAGTYVKEWAHGELGRSRPALPDLLRAPTDILALDVTEVHLAWP